jgi:hypothetical protein
MLQWLSGACAQQSHMCALLPIFHPLSPTNHISTGLWSDAPEETNPAPPSFLAGSDGGTGAGPQQREAADPFAAAAAATTGGGADPQHYHHHQQQHMTYTLSAIHQPQPQPDQPGNAASGAPEPPPLLPGGGGPVSAQPSLQLQPLQPAPRRAPSPARPLFKWLLRSLVVVEAYGWLKVRAAWRGCQLATYHNKLPTQSTSVIAQPQKRETHANQPTDHLPSILPFPPQALWEAEKPLILTILVLTATLALAVALPLALLPLGQFAPYFENDPEVHGEFGEWEDDGEEEFEDWEEEDEFEEALGEGEAGVAEGEGVEVSSGGGGDSAAGAPPPGAASAAAPSTPPAAAAAAAAAAAITPDTPESGRPRRQSGAATAGAAGGPDSAPPAGSGGGGGLGGSFANAPGRPFMRRTSKSLRRGGAPAWRRAWRLLAVVWSWLAKGASLFVVVGAGG